MRARTVEFLNRKQLEELSAQEQDATNKAFYRIIDYRRLCQARGETPSLSELTTLPYKDKIEFAKSYAYVHAGDLPLALILPFYEQIVAYLLPYKKPKDFIDFVGIETEGAEEAAQALVKKIRSNKESL